MQAISSYRGNRPTNTQTNPETGPITIHCTAKLSTPCNNNNKTEYRQILVWSPFTTSGQET